MPEKDDKKKAKEEWEHLGRIGTMIFITFVCCILFFFALYRYSGFAQVIGKIIQVSEPIIFGFVLAYLMNPIMLFFEKRIVKKTSKKAARIISVTITLITLLLIIGLLLLAIVPSVISGISNLAKTLPENVTSLVNDMQAGTFGDSQAAEFASNALKNITDYVEEFLQKNFLPNAEKYIATISSGVFSVLKGFVNFIIGIIVMVYIMSIQETLIGQSKKIVYAVFKAKTGNHIIEVTRKAHKIFGGFIIGKIIDSFIIGVIAYIGCLILHIPSTPLVAVIIGVTNVIPVFGPFIGAIPCLLLVVIQSPWHALYLLIFILLLQQVDGNIIGPKILGSSTGISTFWVMFSIIIGGGMFGFLGMLLGVPVFALIYYIIKRLVDRALRKKGMSQATSEYLETDYVDTETGKLIFNNSEENKEKK